MKAKKLDSLLRLAETKSCVREHRYAGARRAHESLLEKAAALRRAACEPFAPADGDETNADLAGYGRYLTHLANAASQADRRARERAPERAAMEAALRTALREETAWRDLRERAVQSARKERADREEEFLEATRGLARKT